MLKYFIFNSESLYGVQCIDRKRTVEQINNYAEKNGYKIKQIEIANDNGIFVLFEK